MKITLGDNSSFFSAYSFNLSFYVYIGSHSDELSTHDGLSLLTQNQIRAMEVDGEEESKKDQ